MAKTALKVREADVTRAVRGALKAGMQNPRAEIDLTTGRIIIESAPATSTSPAPANALDEWVARHGSH